MVLAWGAVRAIGESMKHSLHFLSLIAVLVLAGCAGAGCTPFAPQSGPPTVGMPAELNERERLFVSEIETALREQGMLPVRHGAGELDLEFAMAAGPVNTDTRIVLRDGGRIVASGSGRASGLPLIGRSKVAENSFSRAFDEFQSGLSQAGANQGWGAGTQIDAVY
jgi:hypothetical protein